MSLDAWCLVVVLVFALLGLWRGAVRQLASLGAFACALVASRPLSETLGPWLAARQPQLSLPTATLLAFVASFALVAFLAYALLILGLRPLPERPHATGPRTRLSPFWNKSFGLGLGALKGGFLLWLLLSLFTLVTEELHWLPFRFPWSTENSRACAFASQYNALNQKQWEKFLALEQLAQLPHLAAQLLPEENTNLPHNPVAQQLAQLETLLAKPEMLQALKNKQFKTLLKDKELDRLLADEPFLKALIDFRNFSKPPPSPPPS